MFPPVLKATEVKAPSRLLQFQVSSVFAFGSPLGIVLANRQRQSGSTNGMHAHGTLLLYIHLHTALASYSMVHGKHDWPHCVWKTYTPNASATPCCREDLQYPH